MDAFAVSSGATALHMQGVGLPGTGTGLRSLGSRNLRNLSVLGLKASCDFSGLDLGLWIWGV